MWIVCQIGGREHYSIPRALHRSGELVELVTDFWVPPGSVFGKLPGGKRLVDRYHDHLSSAKVTAFNFDFLAFEVHQRLGKKQGWSVMLDRNRLFQRKVVERLDALSSTIGDSGPAPTLFSYSYAALEIFREAKKRGWKTVLGQIDPGPGEDAIVRKLRQDHPEWAGAREESPPAGYWDDWKEECHLADRIIANSAWTRQLMMEAGIDASKIEIVPLAYEPDAAGSDHQAGRIAYIGAEIEHKRDASFSISLDSRSPVPEPRPLKILYLGQVIVRKGIQELVEAAKLLREVPVRFDVVGPHGELPPGLPNNVVFHGQANRSDAQKWYAEADVFLLPTHSDGFAITQIEAMAHGVPVIATPCCGTVVEDGVNGLVIPAGDPQALVNCIRKIVDRPQNLDSMRQAAMKSAGKFSIDAVADRLLSPAK